VIGETEAAIVLPFIPPCGVVSIVVGSSDVAILLVLVVSKSSVFSITSGAG
jgi:hypothetical protein